MNKVSDLGATSNEATQRGGAEAALRKGESLMHLVIDDLPAAVVYVDANRRYGFVNKMAETWAAKSRDQMIGKHVWEIFGQSTYQQLEPYIDRVLAGESVKFDAAISYSDGIQRDVSISWVPHLDNGGQVFGYFGIVNDITERAQAVTELRKNEERFELAVKGSSVGLWDWNIETSEHYFSPRWQEILGYDEFEPHVDTFFEFLHPDDRDRTQRALEAHLKDRVPYNLEYRLSHKDGGYLWIQAAGQALWDDNGKPVRMVGSITDISDRKRAEREVVESRDQLLSVTDNLPALIVYIDADLRYRFANKTSAEWHARPVEEMIGKSVPELLGQEYEKLRPRIDRVFAGEQLTYVDSVTYPDGVTRTVRGNYVPHFGEAGSVEGCFSLVEDITELKQAEEALRERQAHLQAIADNSTAVTFLKDTDSRYIFANRVWHDLYNPTGADIVGKTAYDFLPPEIADAVAAADAKVLETGAPTVEELILPTAQSEPQNLLFTKFPVFDEGGNIIALGGFNIDITERKRAEADLRESQGRLFDAIESISEGFILYDAEERLVLCNSKYREFYPKIADILKPGGRLEDIVRAAAERGQFFQAIDDVEGWIDERLIQCRAARSTHEQHLSDGRWVLCSERKTSDGGTVGIRTDITERKSSEVLQRNLSARLIGAYEEERRKISRELHDDFGQRLALLAFEIQRLGQKMSEPDFDGAESIDKLWSQTNELATDLHRLSRQLHPAILDQLGLGPAIKSLCSEISQQHGIQINITEHEIPATISPDIALCLYRTVQEGLRNIVKHSGAKDAEVELTGGPDAIHLRIVDQGVGFDPKTTKGRGLGLVSIDERVRLVRGEFSLQSQPSQGTSIDLRVPLAALDA